MDLFYPEIAVVIGGYTLSRGITITVCSSQASYYDWAKIQFMPQFPEVLTLKKLDEAEVFLGYDGEINSVFKGYVTQDFSLSDSLNEVLLQDATIKLSETIINHVFVDAQPAEVITYCCNQAGLTAMISPVQYPQMTYPVFNETALGVIKGIETNWRIKAKMYMQGDLFCWNPPAEQQQMYKFEHLRNIIQLTKEGGLWVLETVSVPFVKHSQLIAVEHPLITGTFEVNKIVFGTNSKGFIRTQIYFKG